MRLTMKLVLLVCIAALVQAASVDRLVQRNSRMRHLARQRRNLQKENEAAALWEEQNPSFARSGELSVQLKYVKGFSKQTPTSFFSSTVDGYVKIFWDGQEVSKTRDYPVDIDGVTRPQRIPDSTAMFKGAVLPDRVTKEYTSDPHITFTQSDASVKPVKTTKASTNAAGFDCLFSGFAGHGLKFELWDNINTGDTLLGSGELIWEVGYMPCLSQTTNFEVALHAPGLKSNSIIAYVGVRLSWTSVSGPEQTEAPLKVEIEKQKVNGEGSFTDRIQMALAPSVTEVEKFDGKLGIPWPSAPFITVKFQLPGLAIESGPNNAIKVVGPFAAGIGIGFKKFNFEITVLVTAQLQLESSAYSTTGGLLIGWLSAMLGGQKSLLMELDTQAAKAALKMEQLYRADSNAAVVVRQAEAALRPRWVVLYDAATKAIEGIRNAPDDASKTQALKTALKGPLRFDQFHSFYREWHLGILQKIRDTFGADASAVLKPDASRDETFLGHILALYEKNHRDAIESLTSLSDFAWSPEPVLQALQKLQSALSFSNEQFTRPDGFGHEFSVKVIQYLSRNMKENIKKELFNADTTGDKIITQETLVAVKIGVDIKAIKGAEISGSGTFYPQTGGLSSSCTIYGSDANKTWSAANRAAMVTFGGADYSLGLKIGDDYAVTAGLNLKNYVNHPTDAEEVKIAVEFEWNVGEQVLKSLKDRYGLTTDGVKQAAPHIKTFIESLATFVKSAGSAPLNGLAKLGGEIAKEVAKPVFQKHVTDPMKTTIKSAALGWTDRIGISTSIGGSTHHVGFAVEIVFKKTKGGGAWAHSLAVKLIGNTKTGLKGAGNLPPFVASLAGKAVPFELELEFAEGWQVEVFKMELAGAL